MSAFGPKRTSRLLDHFVGAKQYRLGNSEAERLCGLEVADLALRRLRRGGAIAELRGVARDHPASVARIRRRERTPIRSRRRAIEIEERLRQAEREAGPLDFYLYSSLESASTFNGLSTGDITSTSRMTNVADTDSWQFRFRVQRDFYP